MVEDSMGFSWTLYWHKVFVSPPRHR